ncbi:MAG: hypothetical protein P4L56_03630 [Candidatus Sulfopaludibacter sp.]|nr:hypothetical protein [Candidatus Sulfopaludibacter sp.]
MKVFVLLLAMVASAHAQTVWTGTFSNGLSSMVGVRFETRTEPPVPALPFIPASTSRTVYRAQASGYSATHRYFRDETGLTYVGYDLLVEEQPQPDTFRITFLELGLGPVDFVMTPYAAASPAAWKKLATPPLPEPRLVHVGDKVEVPVWIDAKTGQKLVDIVEVQQSPPAMRTQVIANSGMGVMRAPTMVARAMPTVPTVEGTAREFRAEDAEMRLVQPRVTVNGAPEVSAIRAGNVAMGTLVWFYLPNHGRYILSLVPRPDLGFSKAGEVRGGAIQFKMEDETFLLEAYQPIAPGSAPYVLYAMHDKEWEPTARNQSEHLLFGSVSPAELLALRK